MCTAGILEVGVDVSGRAEFEVRGVRIMGHWLPMRVHN